MTDALKFIASVFFLFIITFFPGCKSDKEVCVFMPDLSALSFEVQIENLQDALIKPKSEEELSYFLDRHPVLRDYFLRKLEYPNQEFFIKEQFSKFNNPHIDTLYQEVKSTFGDLSELKEEFTRAFMHIKYYYPDFVPPKIQTAISGFDTDLIVSDTLIIIGLDYYLRPDAKYRPRQMYDYMLRRYQPEYIVPSTILLMGISAQYNRVDERNNTILADMIAYGKSFYFTKHMMPCVPDSILIWYTTEEIEGAKYNEDKIWKHFIDNQLLYQTSHMVKRKYLDERPKTYEIDEKCPGRIGTWLGWQIVKQYAAKSGKPLQEIMENADADLLFRQSGYKPQK